jgi:hypothetical protein
MKPILFLLSFVLTLAFATTANAYVKPNYNDIKLPNQRVLEFQDFGEPIAASSTTILEANAGTASTSASVTVTSFKAQPDVPRNLVVSPGGTTTDIESCVIVVAGTNILGRSVSETFTFSANQSSDVTGAKAFKTVASVTYPVDCESGSFGATWSIGGGEKLGLRRCLDYAGYWGWSLVAGSYESTRATVVADNNEVEKNTADFNGTMNGSNNFTGLFIQNFAQACQP